MFIKRKCLQYLLVMTVTVLTLVVHGEAVQENVSSKVKTKGGKTYVTIANSFIELTFTPETGGICSKFIFKDTGEELIGEEKLGGMFKDHWSKYSYPSGLMWLPYKYKIVDGDGEKRVGIRLWIKVPEKGGGKGSTSRKKSSKIPTSSNLVGLVFQKTIWLNATSDTILVEYEIKNSSAESRSVAPYIQHCLSMGGSQYNDIWYFPSINGVEVNVQPIKAGGKAIGPNWIRNPVEGWMAVNDQKTKRGMLFVFDYNYLAKIYTCGVTAEWFMDSVPVGPGKSFKFHNIIKPIRGFKDIVYGSDNIVADIRPNEKGREVRIALDIAAVKKELQEVDVDILVISWKSKKEITKHSIKIGDLGFNKVQKGFSFTPKALADGVVIKAIVRGKDFKDCFEYYYAGDREEYDRRYEPFATKGQALVSSRGDAYFRKQPRKHKVFDKPDFSTLDGPAADKFKILVVFGLYTQMLNIDDALEGWTHKGNKPQFTWANCPPNAIETFPGTYKELFSYNTIVLSDVNYKAISDIGFEMICDYVEQGGNLLVTGGPYALGNGEFEGTRFLDVLPVTISGPFDLKWAGTGKSWYLKSANRKHPVLKGISFNQNPRVFQFHFVTPKKNAEVLLKVAGKPALILGKYGKGNVAVLTLSPTGMGGEGETQWWDWNGWFKLVKNIFNCLNEDK